MKISQYLTENWLQKIIAFIIAIVLWLFVSTEEEAITQRSFLVPINAIGLADDQIATGIPEFVEVTLSGPSTRIDALKAENIEAILDLNGVGTVFARAIQVSPPQGITLLERNPSEVIGDIEVRITQTFPVVPVFMYQDPTTPNKQQASDNDATKTRANNLVSMSEYVYHLAEPVLVTVKGRGKQVAQVFQVVAPVNLHPDFLEAHWVTVENKEAITEAKVDTLNENDVSHSSESAGYQSEFSADSLLQLFLELTPYASTADGIPVPGIEIEPETVTLFLQGEKILHTASIPLQVDVPDVLAGRKVRNHVLSQAKVDLVGEVALLALLTEVEARLEVNSVIDTAVNNLIDNTIYTFPLQFTLPEGVYALQKPTLTLQFYPEEDSQNDNVENNTLNVTPSDANQFPEEERRIFPQLPTTF